MAGAGKWPMKIRQYCSVCKAEYDMEVVPSGDGDDDPVVWLRCPSCEGYLPKIRDSEEFKRAARRRRDGRTVREQEEAEAPAPPEQQDAVPDEQAPPGAEPEGQPSAGEPSSEDQEDVTELLAEADLSQAVPYRPWMTFAVGQIVHHLAWDDYGLVMAKERLPGNRQVVKVRFANAGTVRLIENDGTPP